jgi:hypothetical protein
MASGFVCYPIADLFYTTLELHYCQCCGRCMALPHGRKYCVKCGRNYLIADPIDAAIAQMILEQENLLKRKYLRENLSRDVV